MSCFECGSFTHLRHFCQNVKKIEKNERVNQLAGIDEIFKPFISKRKINRKEINVLKDTGSTIDVISANFHVMNSAEKKFANSSLGVFNNFLKTFNTVDAPLKCKTLSEVRVSTLKCLMKSNEVSY